MHCKWKQLAKIFYFAITCCAVVVYYFYNSNLKPLLYERYSKPLSKLELQSNKELFGSKEWRQYYSEIDRLLGCVENGQIQWPVPVTNLTSPFASHVVVQTRLEYVVGEKLVARVVSKDSLGNRKKYGGDYFYARLLSDRSQGSEVMEGIACDVVDHGDGSYTISAPLLFPGQSALHVDLVHPSDAVVALILETTGSSGSGINFISTYPSKENVKCNVGLPGLSPSQVCNFSQPRKGFVWFCAAPQSAPCPSYVLYTHTEYVNSDVFVVGFHGYFKRNINWKVPIKGSGFSFFVKNSSYMTNYLNSLPSCQVSTGMTQPPISETLGGQSGLYLNEKWQSLQCKNEVTIENGKHCLKNKVVYLIGDSTMRQWYLVLLQHLNLNDTCSMPEHPEIWQQPRHGENREYNITVYYRAHGLPLHNPGPPQSQPFIVDTLDTIGAGVENTIVVLNFALHFCLVDPAYYLHRVEAVKAAVVMLMKRSPNVRILIRGCLRHRNTRKVVPTEWFSFRLCKILQAKFADVPDIGFIDTWQMTTVSPNYVDIHPDDKMISDQIGLFLSYVC